MKRCEKHPRFYTVGAPFGSCPYCDGRLVAVVHCARCLSHPPIPGDRDGYCDPCRTRARIRSRAARRLVGVS